MTLSEHLKERIESELEEMLECDNWNPIHLEAVYKLSKIYKSIMEMEAATASKVEE